MAISELTLILILLLIPGTISSLIYEKLTVDKKWGSFKFFVHSILFGYFSYAIVLVIWWAFSKEETSNYWEAIINSDVPFVLINWASLASVGVGLFIVTIENYKIINWVCQKLKISYKFGSENLFQYFLNSSYVNEVYVRDLEKNLTYHGVLVLFSENDSEREMTLYDVDVYRYEDSEHLYTMKMIYLSKQKPSLIVEVPNVDLNSNPNEQEG